MNTGRQTAALPGKRIPFLDGLRGLAALCVTSVHLLAEPLGGLSTVARRLAANGFVGVYVFFVVSGFAISASLAGTRVTPGTAGR